MTSENERTYSDREFALILDRAAELGASPESRPRPGTGLSIEEIKAIALEAGFDPHLIDRAARELPTNPDASVVERAIGGPLEHELSARFEVRLTEEQSAHLLALVRAAADQHGEGTSTTAGLSWNSVGEGSHLFVSAHREGEGTRVRVVVDRRGVLFATGALGLTVGLIVPFIVASNLDFQSMAANAAIFAGGLGGSLAAARAFWSSTTRRLRNRAEALMELFARTLDEPRDGGGANQESRRWRPT
jgi:hypothetical protein